VRGAYPVHFHRVGDSPNSFVSDCAFFASLYRCIVLHEASGVTLVDNVAFHTTGARERLRLRANLANSGVV